MVPVVMELEETLSVLPLREYLNHIIILSLLLRFLGTQTPYLLFVAHLQWSKNLFSFAVFLSLELLPQYTSRRWTHQSCLHGMILPPHLPPHFTF